MLRKKDSDLRTRIEKEGIHCENCTSNVQMRKAIREHYRDVIGLKTQQISLKPDMCEKLLEYLPRFCLFHADRDNSENDSEVRDPISDVVQQFLKQGIIGNHLKSVADEVLAGLKKLTENAITKIKEIDPDISRSLKPQIPAVENLKWADVFKGVSLCDSNDIPIDNRGSGVRRIILLSFLRAVKESGLANDKRGLIYAIEEPETGQHFDNQLKIVNSLLKLSNCRGVQVLLTTHSAHVVQALGLNNVRVVYKTATASKIRELKPSECRYKTLNAVNYHVFGECRFAYHNELYGFIEAEGLMHQCGNECVKRYGIRIWKRVKKDELLLEEKSICYYIRNWIHHPENGRNDTPTNEDVAKSVEFMENFIIIHKKELSYEK